MKINDDDAAIWRNFTAFEAEFSGKVFIIFSLDGEIANKDVIPAIELEINRLTAKSQVVSRRS